MLWASEQPSVDTLVYLAQLAPLGTALVIAVGAFVGLLQLRHIRNTRRADLWFRIYQQWSVKDMGQALWRLKDLQFSTYEDFVQRYTTDSEEWRDRRLLMNYFEFIGGLARRRFLDIDIVLDYFKELPALYARFRPFIDSYRIALSNPNYMKGFEWLYEEWKKISYAEGWGQKAEIAWGPQEAGVNPAHQNKK